MSNEWKNPEFVVGRKYRLVEKCERLERELMGGGEFSPEERFDHYIRTAIANSPAPVQELGEYLSSILAEDQWPTAERLLNQISLYPDQSTPATSDMCNAVDPINNALEHDEIKQIWKAMLSKCPTPQSPAVPDGLLDLVRFLAETWKEIDAWVYRYCSHLDAMTKYPVVQGTRNQINLSAIAKQPYQKSKIKEGVSFMLAPPQDQEQ